MHVPLLFPLSSFTVPNSFFLSLLICVANFHVFFFPLEIIPVTTHLTSDSLPSFLELFQPPFSAVSLSCHHIKVNEADLLLGENTPCGLHSSGVMTGLFLYLWHTLVLGAVSCSGFSFVILIKKAKLAVKNLK